MKKKINLYALCLMAASSCPSCQDKILKSKKLSEMGSTLITACGPRASSHNLLCLV